MPTDFPVPQITNIGFTSARIIIPDESTWPSGVESLDLYLKLSTETEWPDDPIRENLSGNNIVILTEDDIEVNKTYHVKFKIDEYESPVASFSTLSGSVGLPTNIDTQCVNNDPEVPGPVTFDEPLATSVICIYRDPLPARTSELRLVYRTYDVSNTDPWIVHPTINFERNQELLVEGLTPSTEYEFRFEAENAITVSYGPIARYETNAVDSPAELVPEKPSLSTFPCPQGKTEVTVVLPSFVGSAISSQLQYSLSIGGPWVNHGGVNTTPNDEIVVNNLNKNTVYYFRVIQYTSLNNEYVGKIANIKTLPDLPDKPEKVTFGIQTDNSIEIILPDTVNNLSSYSLEKGEGSSESSIVWGTRWNNLSPNDHFPDLNLDLNKIYWYRVIAVNDCGEVVSDPDYIDTHEIKQLPSIPGPVVYDDIQATRFLIKIIFDYPERCDNLILYQINNTVIESGNEIQESDREVIKQFILPDEDTIPIFDLTPNSTYYYQFGAKNKGGINYGPISGINTNEDEIKLAPLKPEPPVKVGETKNIYLNNEFINHEIYIQSPVWSLSSSRPVEGMELWVWEEEEGIYKQETNMVLVYENGDSFGPNNDPWYPFSEAIVKQQVKRATTYKYKVRAFNMNDMVKQVSPFSDEIEIDLNSTTCTVEITDPSDNEVVFFKKWINFTVTDEGGHSDEQIFVRGYPAQN